MSASPSLLELLPMNGRDLDDVLRIEEDVYPYPWTRGNFADSLDVGYSCWVLRNGVELIGYFVVMLVVDEAHLLNISVARRHHGKGFGARLLRFAMEKAKRLGAQSLLLEVRPTNAAALVLYHHYGFAEIGRRKGYYPALGGREDAIVMRRTLEDTLA